MSLLDDSLRAVLEASPVPMAINDGAQAVTHLNAAFTRTFGYRVEDMPTLQAWWQLAYPDPAYRQQVIHAWTQRLQACRDGHEPFEPLEVQVRAKDGGTRTVMASASPISGSLAGAHLVTLHDITERKRTEDSLRASEARYRLLAENVTDVIWVLDLHEQRFTYISPSVQQLRGYSAEEIMAQPLQAALTPASADAVGQSIRAALARFAAGDFSTTAHVMEVDQPHRDGHVVHTEVATRYLMDTEGRATAVLGVTRDISARRRVQDQLDQYRLHLQDMVAERTSELSVAKEAAEAANRSKSAFLANMSHELRTPLNAITGFAHLIKRSGVAPSQQDRLDKIIAAGQHLVEIVNAVLELSRIEAGKLSLSDRRVDLDAVVASSLALVSEQAAAKGLHLATDTSPMAAPLHGDPTRLQQALVNYLANAVKFTPAGSVLLRTRVDAETAASVLVRFEVQDTGVGIAPQAMPRLFTAFEQADNSLTRPYGGTGLGLAITRRLAQAMGGDAGAISTPGRGSTFWFTARLHKGRGDDEPAAQPLPATAEDDLARQPAGRRILLAEDDPLNREVIVDMLPAFSVQLAHDGAEAVDLASHQRFDLILLDLQMPRMDGLQAAARIRALPANAGVPIVALTANAFDADRQRCLAAGMDDFLAKPVDPAELAATVLKWLSRPAAG